ncbi:MAG TPA: ABC transporter permease [Solirubrobacterales bacterium]|jgi:ribose transport system permease protein
MPESVEADPITPAEELEPDERRTLAGQATLSNLAERFGLVVAWLLICIVFTIWLPGTFATWTNFQTIFGSQTVLLLLTMGLVVSLSAGEFDLSIASVAGFVGTLFAVFTFRDGWATVPALVAVLAIGLLVGLINAFFIVRINVPSLVMTLGMSTLLVGVGIGIAGPEAISLGELSLVTTANERLFSLPLAWYFAIVLVLLLYYLLEHTPIGRYIRFVGASHEVSRLSAIRVGGVRTLALVGSSMFAAVAGVVMVLLQGAAEINATSSLLLPAFAGAFLGATAIAPRRFNVWGSLIAVYFLVTGTTGLQLAGLAGWVEQTFYGVSLIVGVAVAQLLVRSARLSR